MTFLMVAGCHALAVLGALADDAPFPLRGETNRDLATSFATW
jgi:hypothetical protein